jgi:hypothetical protein
MQAELRVVHVVFSCASVSTAVSCTCDGDPVLNGVICTGCRSVRTPKRILLLTWLCNTACVRLGVQGAQGCGERQ